MKAFWENLFYDLEENRMDKEMFAIQAGDEIRYDLKRIEDAIREYDGKRALDIIADMKRDY